MAEAKFDPLAYLDEMDYNVRGLPLTSHILDYFPESGEKKIKVCRCWQAKKFPICDDTHKQLVEIGDNAGPFIVQMGKPAGGLKNVSALTIAARRSNKFAAGSIALAMLTGYSASEFIKRKFDSKIPQFI